MHRFSPPTGRRREESDNELVIVTEADFTPIAKEITTVIEPVENKVDAESDMELSIDTVGEGVGVHGNSTSLPGISPTVSETTTVPGDSMLSLKWNGFQHHIVDSLVTLFRTEELADVTLIADNGEPIKAHKIVLALSSPYFRKLFQENPCKHPIVVLQGVRYEDVVQVMNFIYKGQVRVCETDFDDFMEAAESLKIDGINAHPSNASDATEEDESSTTQSPQHGGTSPGSTDESQRANLWQSFSGTLSQPTFSALPDDVPMTSPNLPGVCFRKRSSVSSGISSGTVGSLNDQRGLSAPSSPPTPLNLLQHQALVENTIIAGMKPSSGVDTGPVLIEIDEEEAKWEYRARAANCSVSSLERHPQQQKFRRDAGFERRTSIGGSGERRSSLVAEDLSKPSNARRQSPDYERNTSPFRMNTGLVPNVPVLPYKLEKRSTSWPLETSRPQAGSPNMTVASSLFSQMTSKGHLLPPVNPRFYPFLAGNLPRPIAHHPLQYSPSSNVPFGIPPHRRQNSPSFSSDNRSVSPPEARLKKSRQSPPPPTRSHLLGRSDLFRYGSPAHFLAKYGMSPGNSTTALKFTKPKTKAIRSSQVPQSARYTASQVDSMVEKVENFPGPLVPCIVCQKFVKRERLRAHIHECHLLPEEKIECPICKIGLKSKGSFRVHLWRHRRSKTATEMKSKDLTASSI